MALAALIIAVVAVAVSLSGFVWSIVWSIWQHRQLTTGKLYVRTSYAVLLLGQHHDRVISLTATNSGMVPVTITGVVGDVAGVSDQHLALLHWTLPSPGPLPQRLGPGESWSGHYDAAEVARGAGDLAKTGPPWKLTFSVRDAADRLHDAPPIKIVE